MKTKTKTKKPKSVIERELAEYMAAPGEIIIDQESSQTRSTGIGGPGVGLFWPGGSGGGGSRRKKGGGAVVRPHAKTSPGCRLCQRLHTTAEHARHGDPVAGNKRRKATKMTRTAKATKTKGKKTTKAKGKTKAKAKTKTKTKTKTKAKARAKSSQPLSRPGPLVPATIAQINADRGAQRHGDLLAAVREAIPRVGREGRFGPKVFISEIWQIVERDPRAHGLGIDQFKSWLLTANRDGNLVLARADLVGATDPSKVAKSEIRDRGATFHFVLDPNSADY